MGANNTTHSIENCSRKVVDAFEELQKNSSLHTVKSLQSIGLTLFGSQVLSDFDRLVDLELAPPSKENTRVPYRLRCACNYSMFLSIAKNFLLIAKPIDQNLFLNNLAKAFSIASIGKSSKRF